MKKNICIIGLGFIGLPMLINLASLTSKKTKKSIYAVVGLEKNNSYGKNQKKKILSGNFPILSADKKLRNKYNLLIKNDLIKVSTDYKDISKSDILIISIGFDFSKKNSIVNIKNLCNLVSSYLKKNTLIVIETTLPPGFSEKIIYPLIKKKLLKRQILENEFFFGYSFERIMPGSKYLESINNTHRAYSGINNQSALKLKNFLSTFINTKKYQLTKFEKIEECELCKIVENSYRALNIAFIDEWLKFSMIRKLNLNKILDTIRLRETHKNIMRTGLGVGGYCLTKDGNFANISNKFFDKKKLKFPLTEKSIGINKKMFKNSLNFINSNISNLKNKKILVFGYSYKEDIGDYRNSPSILLFNSLKKKVRKIEKIDPYYQSNINLYLKKNYLNQFDILIFSVNHSYFKKNINFKKILNLNKTIFDLNHVIPKKYLLSKYSKNINVLGQ